MPVARLAHLFRAETLVYRYVWAQRSADAWEPAPGLSWCAASEGAIARLFAGDGERRRRFHGFLRRGCIGSFLAQKDQWIAYGWCSPPAVAHPPHLPRWSADLGAWWIFYCHTLPEFRGRGHFKGVLARLTGAVPAVARRPLILCDTLPDNPSSRRAVLSSGFVPAGVTTTFYLTIPALGSIRWGGSWRRDQAHAPELAPTAAAARQAAD